MAGRFSALLLLVALAFAGCGDSENEIAALLSSELGIPVDVVAFEGDTCLHAQIMRWRDEALALSVGERTALIARVRDRFDAITFYATTTSLREHSGELDVVFCPAGDERVCDWYFYHDTTGLLGRAGFSSHDRNGANNATQVATGEVGPRHAIVRTFEARHWHSSKGFFASDWAEFKKIDSAAAVEADSALRLFRDQRFEERVCGPTLALRAALDILL